VSDFNTNLDISIILISWIANHCFSNYYIQTVMVKEISAYF
jgi:hypothetical protein